MLLDSPRKTIRLYIAVEGNELANNFPGPHRTYGMSLSFHPHHCNLTLHCIKGIFMNWEVKLSKGSSGFEIKKYKYQSKISAGELKFKEIGKSYLETTKFNWVNEGEAVFMKANDIHTVACSNTTTTAWLVYEGKESEQKNNYCWSNVDLNDKDDTGLYQKPTAEDIYKLLELL